MRKLTLEDYREIKLWMYRNARPVELAIWQYNFEGGSTEAVLSALAVYQNEDGGFGHALEADSWNPNSSPYTTLAAIHILKGISFADQRHPMIQGIFKFLESSAYCSENGWHFNNAVEDIGVTAEIAGFLLSNAAKDSEIYKKALTLSDVILSKLGTSGNYGDTDIGGYCILLDSIKQAKLTSRFDCDFLTKKLAKLVYDSIEREPSKWAHYTVRPSDYIESPDSLFYKDNEEIMLRELDYILETRPQNGVWDITWSWFENNDRYAKDFALSELCWKASKAIHKLNVLKNFNRVDDQVADGWR